MGIVAGLPSWIGALYFLTHPAEISTNPGSVAFAFVIGLVIAWTTYRWYMIGGTSTRRSIVLRGWFSTLLTSPDRLAEVRRVSAAASGTRGWHYELFDYRGESLGVIPSALQSCKDWDSFLEHLHAVAAETSDTAPASARSVPRDLADIPVDQWTAEDIERYESNN